MKVFQTPTAKKKKIYHIFRWNTKLKYKAWCTKGSIDITPYHPEAPEVIEYDEDEHTLCALCVGEAYRFERIRIIPID